jgi:hypothetical protein
MIRILATALLVLGLTASGAFATSIYDLAKAGGLYYKKFSDVPFTGELDEGLARGAVTAADMAFALPSSILRVAISSVREYSTALFKLRTPTQNSRQGIWGI